jgi:hypothetical protein
LGGLSVTKVQDTAIGLGWRVHSWWAVVVAVSGPAASPAVAYRERVTLVDDESLREPYHAGAAYVGGRVGADAEPFLGKARGLIESVEKTAATAAAAAIRRLVSSLGPVAAVGVVGGSRKISSELLPILASHARLHESERSLYEEAVIQGATRAKLPVRTIPATGTLLADASQVLGVALGPSLAALGKSIGSPWQKDHKEATAAALVALGTVP